MGPEKKIVFLVGPEKTIVFLVDSLYFWWVQCKPDAGASVDRRKRLGAVSIFGLWHTMVCSNQTMYDSMLRWVDALAAKERCKPNAGASVAT